MRDITTTVYQYHELSDDAKEKARDWFREVSAGDDFFSESVFEDAATIADLMGLDIRRTPVKRGDGSSHWTPTIYWSGFYSQGDGACFEGSYRYKPGAVKAVTDYAPLDDELQRIALELQKAQKKCFYRLKASIKHRGHYYHEKSMSFSFDYDGQDDRNTSEAEEAIEEALSDFALWIYKQLRKEYEYQNSDDVAGETIAANEYEFDSEGVRV